MKAALFVGGWEGHTPTHFADWYRDLLTDNGFEVDGANGKGEGSGKSGKGKGRASVEQWRRQQQQQRQRW